MRLMVLLVAAAGTLTSFGWGPGHDTIARETLKRLPGEWGERLRAGKGGKLFLAKCHAPDDTRTRLADCPAYVDETLRTRLSPPNGKPQVMYRFHKSDARCELILALSRAIRAGNEETVGFLLACLNHSMADTASANHSPMIQMLTYHWTALGLEGKVEDDCVMLDKTSERRAVLDRLSKAACAEIEGGSFEPQAVFDAVYADELAGTTFFRYDRVLAEGGEGAVEAFAREAAFAVRRTVEALLAAEAFARLPAEPVFDAKRAERRFSERATPFLAARSMADDAITADVLPKAGHVPAVGVLYDPTGYWTHGIVLVANRVLAVQIAATLKKKRDAALIDLREVIKTGIPDGVDTLVAPCSGLGDFHGFSGKAVGRALERFVARGGKLIWVGGRTKPPAKLYPEFARFTVNPAKEPWGTMRGPVAAEEMQDGTLILPTERFTCVRKPMGRSGWNWSQMGLSFLPGDPLPEGCREIVRFETKDGRRFITGYVRGRCAFVPAYAVFPYVFTETRPCVKPLVLELDAAGAAVMEAAFAEMKR